MVDFVYEEEIIADELNELENHVSVEQPREACVELDLSGVFKKDWIDLEVVVVGEPPVITVVLRDAVGATA